MSPFFVLHGWILFVCKIYTESSNSNSKRQFNWEMSKNQTSYQIGKTEGKEAQEKMLDIINHLGNAHENHNELALCTCLYGKVKKS